MRCLLCGCQHPREDACRRSVLPAYVERVGEHLGVDSLLESVKELTADVPAGGLLFRDPSDPTYGKYRNPYARREYMRLLMAERRKRLKAERLKKIQSDAENSASGVHASLGRSVENPVEGSLDWLLRRPEVLQLVGDKSLK